MGIETFVRGAITLIGGFALLEYLIHKVNKTSIESFQKSSYFKDLIEYSGLKPKEVNPYRARHLLRTIGFLKPPIYPAADFMFSKTSNQLLGKEIEQYHSDLEKGISKQEVLKSLVKEPNIRYFLQNKI